MRPVGIFDSGVGGLSVAREVARALPSEDLLYVADTAFCPYGDRRPDEVRRRALAVGRHLEDAGAKLVIVACNTATGAALEDLRAAVRVPVVGLEPAVKTAAARTRNGRIGVMATSGTLGSERFARLVREHAAGIEVTAQPCPGLVDLIEAGHVDGPALEQRLRDLAAPLVRSGADTVVLGCTHYPFVGDAISRALGGEVALIDSAPAIARRAHALLAEQGALAETAREGVLRLLTTGDAGAVGPVARRLWNRPLEVEHADI